MEPGTPKIMPPVPATKCRGRDEKCKRARGKISSNLPDNQDRLLANVGIRSDRDYALWLNSGIPALSMLAHLVYWPARMISDFPDAPYRDGAGALAESAVKDANPRSKTYGNVASGGARKDYGYRGGRSRPPVAAQSSEVVWVDDAVPAGASQSVNSPLNVSLRSSGGYYVIADNAGGGDVHVNRTAIGPHEQFNLIDLNGGELESGDSVQFRTWDGIHYVVAENGGAPQGTPPPPGRIYANREAAGAWETFTIWRADGGSGPIGNNTQISLQSSGGYYVCAEGGGAPEGSTPPAGEMYANPILSHMGATRKLLSSSLLR